ncbi:MAG: HAD-IA family hydrolase [Bacteroidales bacterium]|nr:HAD-IA family hydrolase [Bacteroidales bacterium]
MILFDFDGTIANSIMLALEVYNQIAPEYDCIQIDEKGHKVLASSRPQELLKKYGVSPRKLTSLILRIRKEMRHSISELKPIKGMKETLHHLYKEGYAMGIVTSNARKNVQLFLKNNGLEDYFQFIYSGKSMFGKDKVFKRLFRQKGLSAEEVIYVGDETRDIEACKKTGIPIIAVTWGMNNREILLTLEPEGLAERPDEIPGLVQQI